MTASLTRSEDWNAYWETVQLPVEVTPGTQTSTTAITDVIDRFAASSSPLSVLEIGGAPGGYLVHLWRRFGHRVSVLDNSPVGVELSQLNFELLGVPGTVYEGDLFTSTERTERFDIVYSLGLIEHFDDTAAVVAAHLRYLKPGGTLIVGCPNFRGINFTLLRRLSPSLLSWHNLEAMDISTWPRFEEALSLEVRFRDYVGGFQPATFWRSDSNAVVNRALARGMLEVGRRWNGAVGKLVSNWNSPRWSYYALGVYRAPHS